MADSERFYDPNTRSYSTRQTRTAEDVERANDREKFQNFRAPESGSTPKFQPPKQSPGEPLGTYMQRVKEAKRKFEEDDTAAAQKDALKKMEEPK